MSTDFLMNFNKSPHDWLKDLEGIFLEGICKEKQAEISHLVELLKIKQEKLNKLRLKNNMSWNKFSIQNKLIEKYRLETGNQGCKTAVNTLFGLPEIDVDGEPPVQLNNTLSTTEEISLNSSQSGYWRLSSGNLASVNFPPRHILMKIKIIKLLSSLHEEKCLTIESLNKSKELTEKLSNILLLKQETIFKAVETYLKAFNFLNIEVQLLKYKILKKYYSEDEGVVKASQKLKEIILMEVQALESKEVELKEKLDAFKKLEGTPFDRLLRDYLAIRQSICDKKWTLENMK